MLEDGVLKSKHELNFNDYQVVTLTNGKEIIIKNFSSADLVNNAPCLICTGIFTSNNFGNNLVSMIINKTNILYTRNLLESEERIVRQVERNNQ